MAVSGVALIGNGRSCLAQSKAAHPSQSRKNKRAIVNRSAECSKLPKTSTYPIQPCSEFHTASNWRHRTRNHLRSAPAQTNKTPEANSQTHQFLPKPIRDALPKPNDPFPAFPIRLVFPKRADALFEQMIIADRTERGGTFYVGVDRPEGFDLCRMECVRV